MPMVVEVVGPSGTLLRSQESLASDGPVLLRSAIQPATEVGLDCAQRDPGTMETWPRISPPGEVVVCRFRYQSPANRSLFWLALIMALPITGGPATPVPTCTPAF